LENLEEDRKMDLEKLYQNHLDRVSRSFAFCIPRLRPELRHWVSLAYLLFRVVDTVEDSVWIEEGAQQRAFQELIGFFQANPDRDSLQGWIERIPASGSKEEKLLMSDFEILLTDFHSLPPWCKKLMGQNLNDMIRGMLYFSKKSQVGFQEIAELNQYCFFVAGLVGELLTGLVLGRPLSGPKDEELLLKSHHFGIFLQKINILKDQMKDESEGRKFVPSRKKILQSLKTHSDAAFEYILSLRVEDQDYKLFCSFCFFLALFSLPYIENSWTAGAVDKIPRAITNMYLSQVEKNIANNVALAELYAHHSHSLNTLSELDGTSTPSLPAQELTWLKASYSGILTLQHQVHLQLI
jgi:phytoene/squalene synthetase